MAKIKREKTPHAKMLLVALRSVGYTNETAIADIIDNSISGAASEIELYFDWDNQRIIIADNGYGMDYEELMEAMEIGSADPNEIRPSEDLGRFGLGMKTASFSMAKNLLVVSKKDEKLLLVNFLKVINKTSKELDKSLEYNDLKKDDVYNKISKKVANEFKEEVLSLMEKCEENVPGISLDITGPFLEMRQQINDTLVKNTSGKSNNGKLF